MPGANDSNEYLQALAPSLYDGNAGVGVSEKTDGDVYKHATRMILCLQLR